MNKLFIYLLYRITFIALIAYSISIFIQVVITVFDLPHDYILKKTKGGGSYITFGIDGNIVPMQLQIKVLNDTIIQFKKKGTNNYGEFPLYDKGVLKNLVYDDVRKDVAKNRNQMDLDTIIGIVNPYFPDKHPFKIGLRQKEEKRTGKQIDYVSEYSYPLDTAITNPIITFKDIKPTYANVEVKANIKRDRILLYIPEWIDKILILLLIFQLYRILWNVTNNVVFDLKNVKRIRLIGLIMIGFFLEPLFSNYFYHTYVISGFENDILHIPSINHRDYQSIKINFNVMKELKPTNLYVGLIALILATIFKRGLALQQEQDINRVNNSLI